MPDGFRRSLCTPVKAQSGVSIDWWPTFQHDFSHTDYSTSKAPRANQTLWTYTTGGSVESSPVVANGALYVGSEDGYLYAINAYTGSLIWCYNTYGSVQSAATVLSGVVYFGGFHSHTVFALNASTGALIWKSSTSSVYPNEISSTAVSNGLVYVDVSNGGFGGELYAFDESTGNLTWKYVPSSFLGPCSPAVYSGKVYLGVPGQIVCLDALSGNVSWSYLVMTNGPSKHTGDGTYSGNSALLVSDDLVYFDTSRQTVQAWNASNGALVWNGNIFGEAAFSTPCAGQWSNLRIHNGRRNTKQPQLWRRHSIKSKDWCVAMEPQNRFNSIFFSSHCRWHGLRWL